MISALYSFLVGLRSWRISPWALPAFARGFVAQWPLESSELVLDTGVQHLCRLLCALGLTCSQSHQTECVLEKADGVPVQEGRKSAGKCK